jgi:tetratricopeptide (TPR) repeat protein
MKGRLAIAVVVLSVFGPSPARSQAGNEARAAIDSLIAREIEAFKSVDVDAYLELLHPEFVRIGTDGQPFDRNQYAGRLRNGQQNVIAVDEVDITLDSLTLEGDEAMGYITYRLKERVRNPDGSVRRFEVLQRKRTMWGQHDGRWLERRTEVLEVEVHVDGELIEVDHREQDFARIVWEEGVPAARAAFDEARRQNPDTVLFAEATVNQLGYALLERRLFDDAIQVFQMNVEAYPEAWNTYDSLAEGYLNVGNYELAEQFYHRSLELNSENDNARHMLDRIRENAPPPLETLTAEGLGSFLYPGATAAQLNAQEVAMPRMPWQLGAGVFRVDAELDEVISFYRELEPRFPDAVTPIERRVLSEQTGDWSIREASARELPPPYAGLNRSLLGDAPDYMVRVAEGLIADGETDLLIMLGSPVPGLEGQPLPGTIILVIRQRRRPLIPPLPTIDGPEADDLLSKARGTLLWSGGGTLFVLSVPELDTLRVFRPEGASVHRASGPDRSGRIILVEASRPMQESRQCLGVLAPSEQSSREVFCRSGAISHEPIGDPALASVGAKMALVSKPVDVQVSPDVALHTGDIEVWDLEDGGSIRLPAKALRDVTRPTLGGFGRELRELAWLPDDRVVFVELVEQSRLEGRFEAQRAGTDFERWEFVPVVTVLDVETGERRMLTVGVNPTASSTGQTVLVENGRQRYKLVDVETGEGELIKIPGDWRGPVALLEDRWLIYQGIPTTGTEPRYTIQNSPMVGPKPMGDLKVTDLRTGEFQTVLEGIDPRDDVEFGVR